MAIDTTNEKLAIMEFEDVWEPGLPMSPGSIGPDDQQQLLWGFPGVLWSAAAALAFVLDLNTRMRVYLVDLYGLDPRSDLTSMIARYLRSQTGDYTARFTKLIQDATDAMT